MYLQALKILWPALKTKVKLSLKVLTGILISIGLSVAFSYWRKFFYDSIQCYNAPQVWLGLAIFTGLAVLWVLVCGLTSYYTRFLEFHVREFLYEKYKKLIAIANVPNKDQRAQEDFLRFASVSLSFLRAIIDAVVRLPTFLVILLSVAPWWVVAVALTYCVVGTILSKKVANKLVILEYVQEGREADLRRAIIHSVEEKKEMPTLDKVKENWVQLAIRNKYLSFYTSGYNQLSVILPYIMLLPLFLSKAILLGTLFQVAGAVSEIFDSLSVFVNSRDIMVNLQMVVKRISELE